MEILLLTFLPLLYVNIRLGGDTHYSFSMRLTRMRVRRFRTEGECAISTGRNSSGTSMSRRLRFAPSFSSFSKISFSEGIPAMIARIFGQARTMLSEVVPLRAGDAVSHVAVPEFGAVLLYSNSIDESLSRVLSQTVLLTSGESVPVYPELYYILKGLPSCPEYNRILASYKDGYLHLAVAQGKTLLLANVYEAADFTTAEYFIFLVLKTLQLNPEVSTISWRTPLSQEEEMSLYRYFKAVEVL